MKRVEIDHNTLFLDKRDEAAVFAEIEDAITTVVDAGQYRHRHEQSQTPCKLKVIIEVQESNT